MNVIARVMSKSVHRATVAIAIPLLAAVTSAAPASATTIERVVSASGVEAWLVHESAVPLIAIDFAFSGGAAQDPAGKAGTAYLAASTLNDGVGEFDSKTFHERLERKAIELNFSADRDALRGSLRTLSENRDEAFEDLRLSLTAARFDANDVELNRAQILSALRRATTSPTDIANQRWWDIAFAGHPYSRPANGTLELMPNISVADVKSLCAPRTGARQPQDRRGWRHRCRNPQDHARPRVRRAAGEGGVDAGRQRRAAGPRPPHRRQPRRAAGGDRVRRRRHRPQGSRFHGRLYRQPHSRRRRFFLAALSRGAREARARLRRFRQPVVVRPHRAVSRLDRDARGSQRRNPRSDPEGNPPPRRRRPDRAKSSPRPRPISTLRSRSISTPRARSLRCWCSCSATISASITSRGGRR